MIFTKHPTEPTQPAVWINPAIRSCLAAHADEIGGGPHPPFDRVLHGDGPGRNTAAGCAGQCYLTIERGYGDWLRSVADAIL